jgi:hypothetical protein
LALCVPYYVLALRYILSTNYSLLG